MDQQNQIGGEPAWATSGESPPAHVSPPVQRNPTKSGILRGLFDLSFSTFVTTKIVKVIYVLALALAVLQGLAIAGFGVLTVMVSTAKEQTLDQVLGVLGGTVIVLLSPVVTFLAMVVARLYAELVIVLFRIAENIVELNGKTPPR